LLIEQNEKLNHTCVVSKMPVTEIKGDLLTATSPVIAHQCNCRTTAGKGLSQAVFARFPWADIYKDGTIRVPGTVIIRNSTSQANLTSHTIPSVANLLGQDRPGRPSPLETAEKRLVWFTSALQYLAVEMRSRGWSEVAMPKGIGCGLAGGNWVDYLKVIQEWSSRERINVVLYNFF